MEEKDVIAMLTSLRCIHPHASFGTEEGFVQIGDISHRAADMIEALAYANKAQEEKIADLESLLREAFPIRP